MELLSPTLIRNPSFPASSPLPKSSPILLSDAAHSFKTHLPFSHRFPTKASFVTPSKTINPIHFFTHGPSSSSLSSISTSTAATASNSDVGISECTHWIVVMDKPPDGIHSKADVVNYYVETLTKVLGSKKEAQSCIYNVSWQTYYGFCCDIDEKASRRLSGMPGILSVRPDTDFDSIQKDYSFSKFLLGHLSKTNGGVNQLFSGKSSKYWLVRMEKPAVEVVTKAQIVDYYAQILTKVLGNEKDAQMCIYHISWQNHFGFCCELDEECAQELAGVPGVLSVLTDTNFGSVNMDYEGDRKLTDFSDSNQTPDIRTKRLFVTGLSFYTSEKTLRAAFEGFGELVEVKIIMDKISKRSKGYAFIEYTAEEAAGAALKEMNGKIINGWMIVVDVAKTNPTRYNRDRSRPTV